MDQLRRLLGRDTAGADPDSAVGTEAVGVEAPDLDAAERQREFELLRDEQAHFDDLTQRQLRYARYAWEPPAQGSDRRADDADAEAEHDAGRH